MSTSPPQQQFAQAFVELIKMISGVQQGEGSIEGIIAGDELPPMQDLSVLPPRPEQGRGDGAEVLVSVPMADGSQIDLVVSHHPALT